ncbi:MAG: hypothetical protein ABFS43_18540, partial [Thermodesulfobacteriota bacterium]
QRRGVIPIEYIHGAGADVDEKIGAHGCVPLSNQDKLEKKKIIYHENTNSQKHEINHEYFRAFLLSCFRD